MVGTNTVEEVAQILGLSFQAVRELCRMKRLDCEKIGNLWLINSKSVETYNQNRNDKDNIMPLKYTSNKPKVLSFFSGAMGLDIGFEEAGFETILACEIDRHCRDTIRKNKPNIPLIGDIRDYSSDEIRSIAGLNEDEDIDLIIGGPPCQAFSTAGKRQGFEDERGNVFLTYIDRIIELNPKFAVIENVRGLLSAPLKPVPHTSKGMSMPMPTPEEEKGGALMHILKRLKDAGYGVSFELYNAANFGTPQKRERVIIICSRDGKKLPYLEPTHSEDGSYGLPFWKTFKEAVSGLENAKHDHLTFPDKRLKYYRLLKPGQYWKHLPEDLQKEAMGKSYYLGGGKTGFLRRLDWDKPAPTLVTHPAMPATDLAHPEEHRPLSIQEYKRLQQFPDTWILSGNILQQYKQLGNAVPVGLGKAVGIMIKNYINGERIRSIETFPYSRYKGTDETSWEEQFQKRQLKFKNQSDDETCCSNE